MSAARSGNIEGAVGLYNQCQKTGGSASALANARTAIDNNASGAVRSRAFLGNCPGAKSAADSAASIGAMKGRAALATTSCK
jgi:hypothetical protein